MAAVPFLLLLLLLGGQERQARVVAVAAESVRDVRQWDATTRSMLRSGDLRVRQTREDTLIEGQITERADQYYKGVRVFGADIARQLEHGIVKSVFGRIYTGIDAPSVPGISSDEARTRIERLAGEQGPDIQPELLILPLGGDPPTRYRLV